MGFSLVAQSRDYSPVAVHGLLSVVASAVAEHRLYSTGSIVVVHRFSYSMACGIFPDHGSNSCLLYSLDSWNISFYFDPLHLAFLDHIDFFLIYFLIEG